MHDARPPSSNLTSNRGILPVWPPSLSDGYSGSLKKPAGYGGLELPCESGRQNVVHFQKFGV
jgi:hypothetical protein